MMTEVLLFGFVIQLFIVIKMELDTSRKIAYVFMFIKPFPF